VAFQGGIDLSAQRLPEGPDYVLIDRLQERIAAARRVVASWPEERERSGCLYYLDYLSTGLMASQDTWFTRLSDAGSPGVDRLIRVLREVSPAA
jgi:hypothetical protein